MNSLDLDDFEYFVSFIAQNIVRLLILACTHNKVECAKD